MRKQRWNRFLVAVISILLVCATCFAASAKNAENSDFEINGTTLVKYNGPGGEVTVPEDIEALAKEAFQGSAVTKVNLPEGLKSIGSHCFFGCSMLKEITLPASLREISEAQAFAYNRSLQEFKVAEGNAYFKSVDGVLFSADGRTLLYFPDGKSGAYEIPEGTEKLGYTAFEEPDVESISIPASLRGIGGSDFSCYDKLKEISVSPDHPDYYTTNGILYDRKHTLLVYPHGKEGDTLKAEDFEEGLTAIGRYSFEGNRNLKTVELPDGLKELGYMSFRFADSLEEVIVPASVTQVGAYAFADCPRLNRVTILNPDVVIEESEGRDQKEYNLFWDSNKEAVLCGYAGGKLQAYAEKCGLKFEALEPETGKAAETAAETAAAEKPAEDSSDFTIEGTTLVKYNGPGGEVTVPEGIEALADDAFDGSAVTKVNLPESLKSIGSHCFFNCYRLGEITLPASLEGLEREIQPFAYSALREFKTAEGGHYKAVDGVLFTADGKTLVCYPPQKADKEYAIPEGTERLGQSPFDGLQAETVTIPSTLTDMGMEYNVFVGTPNLRSFNVSPENKKYYSVDGVLYSGDRLVSYPNKKEKKELKPTDFPAGLKEIGDDSFWGNEYLESVELPEGIEIVGGKSFIDMKCLKTLLIPASVKEIGYLACTGNRNLEKVTILNPDVEIWGREEGEEAKQYNILCWADTTNAVLCGYAGGKLQAYAEKCGLKFEALDAETGKTTETAAVIPAETAAETAVETAAEKPLEDYSDFEIEGTTLVRYNGPGGEVTVPEGVETLGEWAFSRSGITRVNLPESLKTIEHYCFHSCDDLEEITIPASVAEIHETQAFAYNTNLRAIYVAEGNPYYTSVDGVLFTDNGKKLLYYPAGKNRGGEYAIPEGTVSLGYTTFEGTGLTAVTLPASLVTLPGGNDFSGNLELEEIRVAEGNPAFRSMDGMLFDQAGKLLCYPAGRKTAIMGANDFPAEMTAIGPWAFQHAEHLRSITVPNGIKTIDWMCFTWAKSLESVILPASVNYIAGYAFADCPELRQLVILNPNAYIVLDDERFSDEYRATMNFNIVDDSPKAVLYGYEGSTTQEYAAQRNNPFVSLGQAPAGSSEAAAEPAEQQTVPGCAR